MVEIGIVKLLSIESLQETDSGIYECILTNKQDGGEIRRSRKRLQVSPTIGQLEVVTASRSIDVKEGVGEGASVQLIHIAKAYPSLNVKKEWRKVPTKVFICYLLKVFFVFFLLACSRSFFPK